jgi:hypothetical protein
VQPCLLTLPLLVAAGCAPLSEEIEDPAVGPNGGFEVVRSGLPVNWLVYSPRTVPTGEFALAFDREDFREGEQSLRFDVVACSSTGGWHSPGLAQELPAEPGATYRVRVWVKGSGCDWTVSIGGVAAKTSTYERIASEGYSAGTWHLVERELRMPEELERLRFELSVTSPGTLWVDDVRIEPANG